MAKRTRLAVVGTIWALLLVGIGIGNIVLDIRDGQVPYTPSAGASSSGDPRPGDLTVLFLGNSFTTQNRMPLMVVGLAAAANERRRLYVRAQAPGGATLHDHATTGSVTELLAERAWDYVVLQEQSQVPGYADLRDGMIGDASTLETVIDAYGAKTALFVTWGYRHGLWAGDSFAAMEARTEDGYRALARALSPALTVRAGPAFATAHELLPDLDLWAADDIHPSRAGSYLVACAFYDALYGRHVTGNSYTGGLDGPTARVLQHAADVVSAPVAGGS